MKATSQMVFIAGSWTLLVDSSTTPNALTLTSIPEPAQGPVLAAPSFLNSVEEAPAASGIEDFRGHFSVNFPFPIKAFGCIFRALAVLMARSQGPS